MHGHFSLFKMLFLGSLWQTVDFIRLSSQGMLLSLFHTRTLFFICLLLKILLESRILVGNITQNIKLLISKDIQLKITYFKFGGGRDIQLCQGFTSTRDHFQNHYRISEIKSGLTFCKTSGCTINMALNIIIFYFEILNQMKGSLM